MDVLRPAIVRIGGRCYRKNAIQQDDDATYQEEDLVDTEDIANLDEECDDIEKTTDGYRLTIDVPSACYKFIIGKKGDTKKRLEVETRTQIQIPRIGQEGEIVLQGQDRKGILSAKTRIEVLVQSARKKQPFTHFISFPMNSEEVQQRFVEFKSDVIKNCAGERGIDKSIFQNPKKLHLTLGTLVLLNEREVREAAAILEECWQNIVVPIIEGSPLTVRFQGLEYMNDDPGEVDVLYGKVESADSSDRLQSLSESVLDVFVSAGKMERQYDRLKLHVTLMNTLFRQDHSGVGVTQAPLKGRESFDATKVLKIFEDFSFGELSVNMLHLSQRYSTACDGFYSSAAKISLQ